MMKLDERLTDQQLEAFKAQIKLKLPKVEQLKTLIEIVDPYAPAREDINIKVFFSNPTGAWERCITHVLTHLRIDAQGDILNPEQLVRTLEFIHGVWGAEARIEHFEQKGMF